MLGSDYNVITLMNTLKLLNYTESKVLREEAIR